ncbi:hypothetical protein C8T65DRAFT_737451 [Cerioporus squamosus]|nr:hypothetical protein C8T65DRAFT_737451 [Cerioporus squamosus]
MKFSTAILAAAAIAVSVRSRPVRRDVNAALVPEFGVSPGVNPTGTGDCDGVAGANGQPIKIPCTCPPDRNSFIALLNQNVAAGFVVNNPSNIKGPGVGCPQAATTFGAQAAAIQAEPDTPAPSAPAAAAPAAPANNAAPAAGGVDPSLVPDFGIPCTCPPSRDDFLASLNANVAAGHAINNPPILTPFPTGSSKGDQQARIATLLSTLQNLHGAGVGCPAVSTVYGQLQQQINALPN